MIVTKKLTWVLIVIVLALCAFTAIRNSDEIFSDFSSVDMVYENDDTTRFYYNRLTDNAKLAYTLIVPEIYKHTEKIEIPKLSDEEFDAVMYAVSYDNPDLVCYGKDCKIINEYTKHYFVPSYTHSAEEHDGVMAQLNAALNSAVAHIPQGYTDYQKEMYIHDFICDRCSYVLDDDGNLKTSPYDVLIKGEAVCEGYARTAQLFLNKLNIPNYIVVGESENRDGQLVGHMWNVVRIDGENYYLDVTWDDLDSQDVEMDKCYLYFNLNEQLISNDHFNIVPAENNCNSVKDNYFERLGSLYTEYGSTVRQSIENDILWNISKGDYTYEMKFTNDEAYSEMSSQLLNSDELLSMLRSINEQQSSKRLTKVEYVTFENADYVRFIFS